MRLIFLGTPHFGAKILEAILQSSHQVIAVVCQPDRANTRGNKIIDSPVKILAMSNNIPVFQWEKISKQGLEVLKELSPDIIVTAAYGQILSDDVLSTPKHGVINVHSSLLPKYRGSSPVQWALINGEKTLGVTIMQTAKAVDSGDIILQENISLDGSENTQETLEKMAILGGKMIITALNQIATGSATFTPQIAEDATFCRMLTKADGLLNFDLPSNLVIGAIRGLNPWPSAYFVYENTTIKVLKAKISDNVSGNASEILISSSKGGLIIGSRDKGIEIEILQAENGKAMSAKDYLNGKKMSVGAKING